MAAAPALAASGALVLSACGPYPVDATDQHDAAAPESAPVFGDIRQEAFDSSLAAESVTVTGEMEAGEAELDELFGEIDEEDSGQLEILGALDGTASQMSFSAGTTSFTHRVVEGDEYFAGEEFAQLLAAELNDEDDVDEDEDEAASPRTTRPLSRPRSSQRSSATPGSSSRRPRPSIRLRSC
ncbi:hypothetical protein [Nesterenkonia sp. NBAIMH1]|uniref:hypothetical protein n=1 Tax=Nesterenkonia sp. NBAIMH1 TaxID=2600320 RepID=UPI0011B628FE|nr:hypothetical protein [Nesterenkonia sp. NBAIMH1]